MDSLNYANVECKDCVRPVCFVIECNNLATTYARIKFNDRIDGLIRVCNSCRPKIQTEVMDDIEKLMLDNYYQDALNSQYLYQNSKRRSKK